MKEIGEGRLHGFLAALAHCATCARALPARRTKHMPTVKTFAFLPATGMSVDQMRSYQIGETKRGRLAAIELYLALYLRAARDRCRSWRRFPRCWTN